MAITTVKLDVDIKHRLDAFKVHPRETYNEVIQRLLDCMRLCRTTPEQARAHLIRLDRMRDSLSGKASNPFSDKATVRPSNLPRASRTT